MPTIQENTLSVQELLKNDSDNAYNYREISESLDMSVGSVKEAIKRLMTAGKVERMTAKRPVTYQSRRKDGSLKREHQTIQRIAYFGWKGKGKKNDEKKQKS